MARGGEPWPGASTGDHGNGVFAVDGGDRPLYPVQRTGSAVSARLITIRWIWFVPSKICVTLASRM
jgi:hypothetical protein